MCHTMTAPPPTTLSDAHLDSLSRALPFKQEAVVGHRWLELVPVLTLSAARYRNPSLVVGLWKQRHRVAVLLCLERGLPWATIRRYRLDDPRREDALRDEGIAAAADRRRCRLGRREGVGPHAGKKQKQPSYRARHGAKENHADQQ